MMTDPVERHIADGKSRRWLLVCGLLVFLCVGYLCYRYNVDYDIGVNHGVMLLWFVSMNLTIYLFLLIAIGWVMWLFRRPTRIWKCAVVLIFSITTSLIVDLHYYANPSPVLEGSMSVFWSRIAQSEERPLEACDLSLVA